MTIPGGLEMTTSKDVLEALATGAGPRKVLVSLGYSAWGEGQLESELAENSWLTVDADPAVIFDTPIEKRYDRALVAAGPGGVEAVARCRACMRPQLAHCVSLASPLARRLAAGAAPAPHACESSVHGASNAALASSRHLQSFLAFDFGHKRTGLPAATACSPVPRRGARCAPWAMRALPKSKRASANGSPTRWWSACPTTPMARRTRTRALRQRFARQLHGRFRLPVFEVDERYSTTEALADGARDADAASACIILEQFLRSLP